MSALGPTSAAARRRLPVLPWAAAVVAAACWSHPAAAAEDGAYGRLDGDLTVEVALGVAEAFPGESLAVRGGAHYLHTVGAFGQYHDSLGVGGQPMARSMAFGLDLRPLFLPRFASDLEQGPAHADLLLDSLSCELAVYTAQQPVDECDPASTDCWFWGLQLGMGLDLPLLGQIDGPFAALRGALRWPTAAPRETGTPSPSFDGLITLSLGYRLLFGAHLVDAGDALP